MQVERSRAAASPRYPPEHSPGSGILPILALAVWSFTAPLGEYSIALMIPGSIYIAACAYKRELS